MARRLGDLDYVDPTLQGDIISGGAARQPHSMYLCILMEVPILSYATESITSLELANS